MASDRTVEADNTDARRGPDEPAVRAFVGRNAQYYLDAWRPFLENRAPMPRLNWAGFFLGPFWLGYRKLFTPLAIYFAVIFATVMLEDFVILPRLGTDRLPRAADLVINLAFAVTVGKFANYWYWHRCEREIATTHAAGADHDTQLRSLAERGGTSWMWAFLGPALLFVACTVVYVGVALLFGVSLE